MKLTLWAFVCLVAPISALGQSAPDLVDAPRAKLTLAKTAKDGTVTENPSTFGTRDVPIICYVDLAEPGPVEVKLVIVAVKAEGLRPGSPVVTVRYKAAEGEVQVTFTARPKDVWAPGSYRSDVYLDGALSASADFAVARE